MKDYDTGDYKTSAIKLSHILTHQRQGEGILIETEIMVLLAKSNANMGQLDEAAFWCQKAIESEKLNLGTQINCAEGWGRNSGRKAIQSS
mgnify:CR=1 FL=1